MTNKVRMFFAMLLLAATLMFLTATAPSRAAGEKDLRPDVTKIADTIKSGKMDDAKAASAKLIKEHKIDFRGANDNAGDLMHMFRARNKGGLGWSRKSITNNPTEDGLEKKVQLLAKTAPANVAKEAPAAEEAGYDLAAMAELIKNIAPAKNMSGGKTTKAWQDYSDQMREASLELAKAGAGKNAAAIGKAAAKVNSTCNACHSKFKE